MVLLLLRKNIEIACPKIAPTNDMMMIVTDHLGVFSKISIPISNIFCTIAVEMARKTPIGKSNRTYFFMIHRMLGSECLNVCKNGFVSKCVS